jgi:hypothetical protein
MARLGIVKEGDGETRVAATPDTVAKLLTLGYEVLAPRRRSPTLNTRLLAQLSPTKRRPGHPRS